MTARTAAFHNRVLNAWPHHSAGDIAKEEGVTPNVVLSVVRSARARGDERAVRKPDAPRKPGWWSADCPRTREIWMAGAKASVEARRARKQKATTT